MADEDTTSATTKTVKKRARKKRRTRRVSVTSTARPTANAAAVKSELPYVMATGRIPDLFNQLQAASLPPRVTFQFLKHLGFASSNDRVFTSLLRKLGFTDSNGVPSDRYRRFRNPGEAGAALAEGMRELYADLFAVNAQLDERDVATVRGVVSRVTGIDARRANLVARTFRTLADFADFSAEPGGPTQQTVDAPSVEPEPDRIRLEPRTPKINSEAIAFRYNIEIHLPATTDIAVYNAIFRSLRDHVLD